MFGAKPEKTVKEKLKAGGSILKTGAKRAAEIARTYNVSYSTISRLIP
jgi:hypothetical protein